MRSINPTFTEDEFQALKDAKQDRTWREAVLDEFGINKPEEEKGYSKNNIDNLGFQTGCGHVKKRGKFRDIPLEHSADMAACKRCWIKLTPPQIVNNELDDGDIPDDVTPGEYIGVDHD